MGLRQIPRAAIIGMLICAWTAQAEARITHGPMLGNVLPDSASVWVRTDVPQAVAIEYGDGVTTLLTPQVLTHSVSDFTAQLRLAELVPDTEYHYRLIIDGLMDQAVYVFRSAPPLGHPGAFKFAIFTDSFGNKPAPSFYAAAALDPDLVFVLGDWDYRNPTNLTDMRKMHSGLRGPETPLGNDFFKTMIAKQIPVIKGWDDHDYANNNSSMKVPRRAAALQAFGEYHILGDDNGFPQGIWQHYRYGNVGIYLLDLRSNRDKSWKSRTILGPEQKVWLEDRLLASADDATVRWRIILTSVPFNSTVYKDKDPWTGYPADRSWLINLIQSNAIKNVALVTGDLHKGAIDDGTHSVFPEMLVTIANAGFAGTGKGRWSEGEVHGEGFGWLEVTDTHLTMSARSKNGLVQLQYTVLAE